MKNKQKLWLVHPMIIALVVLCLVFCLLTLFTGKIIVFYIESALLAGAVFFAMFSIRRSSQDIHKFITRMANSLDLNQRRSMDNSPFPIILISDSQEIIWYNRFFRNDVLGGEDVYGQLVSRISPIDMDKICSRRGFDLRYKNRQYTAYGVEHDIEGRRAYAIFFIDDTELKKIRTEFSETRPSVLSIQIDNYEELFKNSKESERIAAIGKAEDVFDRFVRENRGFFRRQDHHRYIAIIEERYMSKIIEKRFEILDEVRRVSTVSNMSMTLSIGVGRGAKSYPEGDHMARQALEMALGRGGDQAAVKTADGYDFYGGASHEVDKKNKVKTRIVATAMSEIIANSDNCILMGHRLADLDAVGSCVGMATAIRRMGKSAVIAIDKKNNLVNNLISKMEINGYANLFVEPSQALSIITKKTLLIITDTHIVHMLESKKLYEQCRDVVVIDHHRRMVGYIENAVIFFHEPFASSASEMVTELIQYFDSGSPSRLEAEALLGGIVLDTKNFVLKTGPSTFEAAAYLRRSGADTVEVKRLFSSNLDSYRKKAEIVSRARTYRNCAIASTAMEGEDMRIVAPQSADELLTISDILASFVLYKNGDWVSISSRSMGEINVQLIMEKLGGGGHLTMAGAALECSLEESEKKLEAAIDEYLEENKKDAL
ncbi:MAG: DHH family phosphoesterase [Oscillospiraceae bacterium]|jgi:c-di-AMP phosphodiesterase-like protein|nr:DHH family phosphoesterase [Oscillospiraceae bacterium]